MQCACENVLWMWVDPLNCSWENWLYLKSVKKKWCNWGLKSALTLSISIFWLISVSAFIMLVFIITWFYTTFQRFLNLKEAYDPEMTLHLAIIQSLLLSPRDWRRFMCQCVCMCVPNALIWSRWARGSWSYPKPLPPSAVWPAETPSLSHKHTGKMNCLVQKLVP